MSKSGAVWHKALLKMLDKNEKLRYNIKVSLPHAGVMELADVADLKSLALKAYRFKPGHRHHDPQAAMLSGGFLFC